MKETPVAKVTAGDVAALIPAYLEERHIAEVVRRTLPEVAEVLVIDDGSGDSTADLAEAAGARVIRHPTNRGKGAALKTGLRALLDSGHRYFVLLDADGQHLPSEIGRFIDAANASGAGLIVGSRMNDTRPMPFARRWTNRIMSACISTICGQWIPDTQCGFRMLHRDLAPLLFCDTDAYDYETEMLFVVSRAGHAVGSAAVTTVYADETSKIRPVRDTLRFIRLIGRYAIAALAGRGLRKAAPQRG